MGTSKTMCGSLARHQDGFGCIPAAPGVPWGSPWSRLASKHLHSCASEQPFGQYLGSPHGRISCFGTSAPQVLLAEGWWVPGGLHWCSPGGLGTLPGKAAVSRYLPPSSGPSAKCGRRRRRRKMCWVNSQSWARMGLDRGALGMFRAGDGGEGLLPAPSSGSRPSKKSGAAKHGEENCFIVGCQPAVARRHRSGYHGAEQGSGAPCMAG